MDKKFQTFIATLATLSLTSPVFSESLDDDPGEEIHFNDIELGVGYVSDSAWKFGQYNGLHDEGAYAIANLHYKNTNNDNARYVDIRGTNLGLESRYLRLDAGVQGQQEYFFVYDELPNYQNNTGLSPYQGIGSSTLTLPAGYDWSTLDSYLNPVELKTKRKRFDFGAAFLTSKSWKFDIKASHETKEGVQQIGGPLTYNASSQIVGGTVSTLLPEPIDYETNEMDVGIHYSHEKGQLDLVYHVSLFDNDNESLTWQYPFTGYPFDPALPAASYAANGRLALAPSNQHHQVTLSGGYNLPSQTRFTGLVSIGRSTQNEDLLPYGTESGGALPRDTAETEVWTTKVGLKLASRPAKKLRLSGEYRYDGRDNQTPVDTWDYVLADSPDP
ncbi:MAG: MtrB/PioB family decaheme-associated outer membrane protein, partial [Gammaproteobacteria bacterium]|nr:MtrB/PioB family decaheme-associated outer membrane protein [Gammaproteobacteria bacterium]